MPRKLSKLQSGAAGLIPDIDPCVKKAGFAAGKRSPLTDAEILFLVRIADDEYALSSYPILDEDGRGPAPSVDELRPELAMKLAWIFTRDPVGAARAVLAARKEMERMKKTDAWAARRALIYLYILHSLGRAPTWDVQSVHEVLVRDRGLRTVSTKTIHKEAGKLRRRQRGLLG